MPAWKASLGTDTDIHVYVYTHPTWKSGHTKLPGLIEPTQACPQEWHKASSRYGPAIRMAFTLSTSGPQFCTNSSHSCNTAAAVAALPWHSAVHGKALSMAKYKHSHSAASSVLQQTCKRLPSIEPPGVCWAHAAITCGHACGRELAVQSDTSPFSHPCSHQPLQSHKCTVRSRRNRSSMFIAASPDRPP